MNEDLKRVKAVLREKLGVSLDSKQGNLGSKETTMRLTFSWSGALRTYPIRSYWRWLLSGENPDPRMFELGALLQCRRIIAVYCKFVGGAQLHVFRESTTASARVLANFPSPAKTARPGA